MDGATLIVVYPVTDDWKSVILKGLIQHLDLSIGITPDVN